MIPVYVRMHYSAVVNGSTYKKVDCEQCGRVFYYQMNRRAMGEGRSAYFLDNDGAQDRAHERAEQHLHMKLDKGCEPVRCPDCGWFQAQMVATIKNRRYPNLRTFPESLRFSRRLSSLPPMPARFRFPRGV